MPGETLARAGTSLAYKRFRVRRSRRIAMRLGQAVSDTRSRSSSEEYYPRRTSKAPEQIDNRASVAQSTSPQNMRDQLAPSERDRNQNSPRVHQNLERSAASGPHHRPPGQRPMSAASGPANRPPGTRPNPPRNVNISRALIDDIVNAVTERLQRQNVNPPPAPRTPSVYPLVHTNSSRDRTQQSSSS